MRAALRNPRVWLGVVVSAAALFVAVRGVRWSDLVAALATARYGYLVPSLACIALGQVARTLRWQSLFGRRCRPRFPVTFDILNVGYMVSNVFPLRLGDPVRAWLIDTHTPLGGAAALATVMVERAIDLLMVLALLALLVPAPAARLLESALGPGPWAVPSQLGLVTFGLVLACYVGLWVVSALGPRGGRATAAILGRIGAGPGLSGRIAGLVIGFAAGFAPLRDVRNAIEATFWTLVVWLIAAFETWVMFHVFDIDLPFAAAIFLLGVSALAAILPSSPGYFGVFHSAAVLALGYYGVPQATALAFALVIHAMTMVFLVLIGIWSLWRLGLGTRDLTARLEGGTSTT